MLDFLLEIGTEEMPYWAVYDGIDYLKSKFSEYLTEGKLAFSDLRVYGGPRRFSVLVKVASKQEDQVVKVKGPAYKAAFNEDGSLTQAAIGFARSQGVSVEELKVEEINGGKYIIVEKKLEGKNALDFLKEVLPALISQMSFKKSMRWGTQSFSFVRPVRWIVALLDDEVIEFEVAGVKSGRITKGHRILGEKEISITHAKNYPGELENKGKVIVDHERRRELIVEQAQKSAEKINGKPIISEETLKEVIQLVEWPTIIVGEFEEVFLNLPEEVLITVMQHHQRYFPVRGKDGKLVNKFLVVQNGNPAYADLIKEGNERVVRARLEDARFFFEEDLKVKLEERVPALKGVVFQQKLGNLFEKVQRDIELSTYIAEKLSVLPEKVKVIERAAYLCKADLLTEMVNEFDELQGIMGREYALRQGEPKEVSEAIFEHYLPRFYGDELPKTLAGKVLSIADKLDTVCGYFLAGLEPTGSEDPFSLRRQAQGVCLVALDLKADFDLKGAIMKSLSLYRQVAEKIVEEKQKKKKEEKKHSAIEVDLYLERVFEKLVRFFEARFQRILLDREFPQEVVLSVLPQVLEKPAEALSKASLIKSKIDSKELEDIVTAFTRVKNLSKPELGTEVDLNYLEEEAEVQLEKKLSELLSKFPHLSLEEKFNELAGLRETIDRFFDTVLVMHEDKNVRENRLKLLNKALNLFVSFADFSFIKR